MILSRLKKTIIIFLVLLYVWKDNVFFFEELEFDVDDDLNEIERVKLISNRIDLKEVGEQK